MVLGLRIWKYSGGLLFFPCFRSGSFGVLYACPAFLTLLASCIPDGLTPYIVIIPYPSVLFLSFSDSDVNLVFSYVLFFRECVML